MKRFIFSAIALIVAATSCTESGLIDSPELYGSQIVFGTYIGKAPVTKAEDITLNYLETNANGGAQVYSFMTEKGNRNPDVVDFSTSYMDGKITNVTPTTYKQDGTINTNGEWQYEVYNDTKWTVEEVYWPGDVDLAFAAYNLMANNCISNLVATKSDFSFDFEVKSTISEQVDLLVAPLTFVSEAPNDDTNVNLHFRHLLSRVGFSVIATSPNDNVDITISSLRLCGMFPQKGKVSLKSTSAAIQAYEENYATYYDFFQSGQSFTVKSSVCGSTVSDNSRIHAGNVNDRFMMLMPGQLDGAYIEVEYQLTGAEKRFAKVELGSMPLKAGFAYEFVLRVATASIEFSGVVEGDWGSTGTNGNTNIPQGNQ